MCIIRKRMNLFNLDQKKLHDSDVDDGEWRFIRPMEYAEVRLNYI